MVERSGIHFDRLGLFASRLRLFSVSRFLDVRAFFFHGILFVAD